MNLSKSANIEQEKWLKRYQSNTKCAHLDENDIKELRYQYLFGLVVYLLFIIALKVLADIGV